MGTPADVDDPRTMRERMLAGDPYTADDPELAEASRRALDLADATHRPMPVVHLGGAFAGVRFKNVEFA